MRNRRFPSLKRAFAALAFVALANSPAPAQLPPGPPTPRGPLAFTPSTIVNVTDPAYGAKCDGVTNDQAALQAAITANPGSYIDLPEGTCVIGSKVTISTNGTRLRGRGSGLTNIYATFTPPSGDGAVVFTAPSPSSGSGGIASSHILNAGIEGVTLAEAIAGAPASGAGLQVLEPSGFEMADLSISGFFEGAEFAGGFEIFGHDMHVAGGYNLTGVTAGSRYMKFRPQVLSDSSVDIPQGVYFRGVSMASGNGNQYIEDGVEVGGCDGFYWSSFYIGQAAYSDLYLNPGSTAVNQRIADITMSAGMLDGNVAAVQASRTKYPLYIGYVAGSSGPIAGLAFSGLSIGGAQFFGAYLGSGSIIGFSLSGSVFVNNASDVDVTGASSASFTGNAHHNFGNQAYVLASPASIASSGSLTITGDSVSGVGGSQKFFQQDTSGAITGSIAITNNSIGSSVGLTLAGTASATFNYIGNVGASAGSPIINGVTAVSCAANTISTTTAVVTNGVLTHC